MCPHFSDVLKILKVCVSIGNMVIKPIVTHIHQFIFIFINEIKKYTRLIILPNNIIKYAFKENVNKISLYLLFFHVCLLLLNILLFSQNNFSVVIYENSLKYDLKYL